MQIRKQLRNPITPELEGFRRPKQAQMIGNFVEMVQSPIRIDVVGGFLLVSNKSRISKIGTTSFLYFAQISKITTISTIVVVVIPGKIKRGKNRFQKTVFMVKSHQNQFQNSIITSKIHRLRRSLWGSKPSPQNRLSFEPTWVF